MNDLIDYLLMVGYGLLQGLTEVLPISSSGHLAITSIIASSQRIDFTIIFILHAGSIASITWWFQNDLYMLWRQFSRSLKVIRQQKGVAKLTAYQKLPYLLGLCLVSTLIIALVLENWAQAIHKHAYWASVFLFVNGLILGVTACRSRGSLTLDELDWKSFFFIGVMQGIAIIPGISRLGVVLCASLWCGLGWYESLRLSFLLSIPTIIGGVIFHTLSMDNHSSLSFTFVQLLVGIAVSGASSLLGLHFFYRTLLEKRSLVPLGYYCCMVGAFSFVYLFAH